LTVSLLVGLLLVAMFSALVVGRLRDGAEAIVAFWDGRRYWSRICPNRTRWEFVVQKWQRRDTQSQVRQVGLTAAADSSTKKGDADTSEYRFSRFRQFQGTVCPPG